MDDKFKKDLVELLDVQFEKKFIRLFNQGFEEIVLPHIEKLDQEMEEVKNDLETLKNNSEVTNRKLDRVAGTQLDHTQALKNLDQRVQKLEATSQLPKH